MAKRKTETQAVDTANAGGLAAVIVPLVLALAVFFGLVAWQASVVSDNTIQAAVAVKDIAKGTEITEDNFSSYFEVRDVDNGLKVEGTFTDVEDIAGMVTSRAILANEVASTEFFTDGGASSDKDMVEVSFSVSAASYAVGGSIRGGDYVDILVYGDYLSEVLSDVYVKSVYNSSGTELSSGEDGLAVSFVIVIEESERDSFIEKINSGDVYVTLPEE